MITYNIDSKLKVKSINDLIHPPEVVLVNKFDESSVQKFREGVDKAVQTGQPVVPVVIDSYGGQCYSVLAMIDIIKNCPIPVATIVEGKAMSCGAILFAFGEEGHRYVGPNATIMIHDVSSGIFGKVEEIKADAKETDRLSKHIYKSMANHIGQPDSYFLDLIHEKSHADWYLTPEEAKKHKLANHIRLPKIKVGVDVHIEFG